MDQNAARRLVVERNLVADAFGHLTDAFTSLPFEALGPVKTLLKRFLSTGPWGPEDDDALAAAVGTGEGWWERELSDGLTLEFGWQDGRFRVGLESDAAAGGSQPAAAATATADALAGTFDGPVVPEATPNPRTIRFALGTPVHTGPSRWYESPASAGDDPRVLRLFDEFADLVANVLVGPDFVAVGLHRPGDWEPLLARVLAVVTEEFAEEDGSSAVPAGSAGGPPWLAGGRPPGPGRGDGGRRLTRLEQAWQELGHLRPVDPADLRRVVAAASDPEQARRQVAANLLREAEPGAARAEWARLVADPVRSVRRVAVDAMVDAGREELRPLLESALEDSDAWVRWKALRGLVELGPAPSRGPISAKAEDPDFRVRLEAAAALRTG